MSRNDPGPDSRADAARTIDRLAHAFSPAEWSGWWLAAAIAVFGVVAALTVVQRALLAEGAMGWIITSIHGLIVVIVVPALTIRTVRDWRRHRLRERQTSTGVPE